MVTRPRALRSRIAIARWLPLRADLARSSAVVLGQGAICPRRRSRSQDSVAARAGEPPDAGRRADVDLPCVVSEERPLVDAHAGGETADRAHVVRRVVVGEERPVEVAGSARAVQVVGGAEDRVARVVDVAAYAVLAPRRGQELHRPASAGLT